MANKTVLNKLDRFLNFIDSENDSSDELDYWTIEYFDKDGVYQKTIYFGIEKEIKLAIGADKDTKYRLSTDKEVADYCADRFPK